MQTFKLRVLTRIFGLIAAILLLIGFVIIPDTPVMIFERRFGPPPDIIIPYIYVLYFAFILMLCGQFFMPSRIRITPQYIQVPLMPPVFWEDIEHARLCYLKRTPCRFLYLKNDKTVQARFFNLFLYQTNEE